MSDIELLINNIKEQINRAHELIEINIILSDDEKKCLMDNWSYVQDELTKHITRSNFILYSIERDNKGRNLLKISF